MMPWSGNRAEIIRRIAASASRSAMVTGDRSALSSITSLWRKCGRIAAPAASASSLASARKRSRSISVLPALAPARRPDLFPRLFQRLEIGDHVGAVLRLLESREAHLRALGE